MKVLIVNTMAPFVWGGAEELAKHLQKNLIIVGHECEILRIPFQWEPCGKIPSQMLMVKALEIYNVDHVIAMKFPAYLIPHPNKTIWLLHQFRQAYDLYDTEFSNMRHTALGRSIKNLITQADKQTLSESNKLFVNSEVTKKRLYEHNGLNSDILLPPVNDAELFVGGESDNYFFAGGRVNDMKRQYLMLEAMKYVDPAVRLVIAGPPDSDMNVQKLKHLVETMNLADRVKLDLRLLTRHEYADYVNHALAVAYLPVDEDSLGYVTMEAATAAKPILTAKDSGGILGLVKHEQTGWVSEPNANALAEVMNLIYEDTKKASSYGRAANELWRKLNVNWPSTIEKLLQ